MKRAVYWEEDYDWKDFTGNTDEHYREALQTGNLEITKAHNLIRSGEAEIQFILDLAKLYLSAAPQGRALDVACGGGYLTHCLHKAGFESTGFDILQEGVDLARKHFPENAYCRGNGVTPKKYFAEDRFDLILIREFHPFVRLDDFDSQIRIVHDYLDLLNAGGILAIVQSRRRAGCEGLNIEAVIEHCKQRSIRTVSPLFHFPHKHTGIPPRIKSLNRVLSLLTRVYCTLRRKYAVETFLVEKPPASGRRSGNGP